MTSQFTALTHFTSFRNFVKLMDSKALYTAVEREKFGIMYDGIASETFKFSEQLANGDWGEFPGVYMSAKTVHDIGNSLEDYYDMADLILVFSTALLNRPDYHLNIVDNNGYISHRSFIRETLNQYPNQSEFVNLFTDKHGFYPGNEIVFHNYVPLDFLQEIWVSNSCHKNVVQRLMPKNKRVPVQVMKNIPATTYDKLHGSYFSKTEFPPQFAYGFHLHSKFNHLYPEEYVKGQCLNSGMAIEEIYKVSQNLDRPDRTSNMLKLNNVLFTKYVPDAVMGVNRYPLKVLPPFVPVDIDTMSDFGM